MAKKAKQDSQIQFPLYENINGVIDSVNEDIPLEKYAKDITNLHYIGDYLWGSDQCGYTVVNSTITSKDWVCGFHYKTGTINKVVGIDTAGILYDIDFATSTLTVVTGATFTASSSNIPMFGIFGGNLIIVDGSGDPKEWSGSGAITTVTNWSSGVTIASVTYENPSIILNWNNRAVFAGFSSHPSHFVLSDFGVYNTYTVSGTAASTDCYVASINISDGKKITNCTPYKFANSNESVLFIFKENGIYKLSGVSSDPVDTTNYFKSVFYSDTGCIGKFASAYIDGDVIFIDQKGNVRSLISSESSGNTEEKTLDSNYKDLTKYLNMTYPDLIQLINYEPLNEILITFADSGQNYINKIGLLNYKGDGFRWSKLNGWSDKHKSFFWYGNRLFGMYGDTGNIVEWFNTDKYNTDDINYTYEYYPLNLNSLSLIKSIKTGFIDAITRVDSTLNVTYYWDNEISYGGTITGALKSLLAGGIFGVGRFGSSRFASKYAAKSRLYFDGSGNKISISISGTVPSGGFYYLGTSLDVAYHKVMTRFFY